MDVDEVAVADAPLEIKPANAVVEERSERLAVCPACVEFGKPQREGKRGKSALFLEGECDTSTRGGDGQQTTTGAALFRSPGGGSKRRRRT